MFSSMGGGGMDFSSMIPGAGSFISGLMGNSSSGYSDASNTLNDYMQRAQGYQQPWLNAGQGAIDPFNQRLGQMADPQAWYNKMMGGYQESPFAKYQQQQGMRAAQNMGSASGMTGSTPMMLQAQQNAQGISTQDMNNYFQNLMGVNNQYMGGLNTMMGYGQGAANSLTNMMGQFGGAQAGLAYNQARGNSMDSSNMLGGIAGMAMGVAPFFGL